MPVPGKPDAPARPDDYGMEVLCAGWSPIMVVADELPGLSCHEALGNRPAVDIEAFLKQFYLCQS